MFYCYYFIKKKNKNKETIVKNRDIYIFEWLMFALHAFKINVGVSPLLRKVNRKIIISLHRIDNICSLKSSLIMKTKIKVRFPIKNLLTERKKKNITNIRKYGWTTLGDWTDKQLNVVKKKTPRQYFSGATAVRTRRWFTKNTQVTADT